MAVPSVGATPKSLRVSTRTMLCRGRLLADGLQGLSVRVGVDADAEPSSPSTSTIEMRTRNASRLIRAPENSASLCAVNESPVILCAGQPHGTDPAAARTNG